MAQRRRLTCAELKTLLQLYEDHWKASTHTAAVLARHGMNSTAFLQADKRTDEIWRRIRELRGIDPSESEDPYSGFDIEEEQTLSRVGRL